VGEKESFRGKASEGWWVGNKTQVKKAERKKKIS
jgi:hypothetical protein